MKLLAYALCLIAMLAANNQRLVAESRSLLDSIPGANYLLGKTMQSLKWFDELLNNSPKSRALFQLADSVSSKDPDTRRNVSEIIRSRGFEVEEHDVITRDGYILTVQRIINPLVDPSYRPKMKPVILQHGLMSSSVDWVINSVRVRPDHWPPRARESNRSPRNSSRLFGVGTTTSNSTASTSAATETLAGITGAINQNTINDAANLPGDTQEKPNSLGFFLANRGFDVFLANSRGNIYGQRHVKMCSWEPEFWDFTFDEQIEYDLRDTISFVQNLTRHTKVGYVGHSQGTTMMFGLLADRPEYSDIVEPFVAFAPVAYVNNSISPAKYFAVYTPLAQHVNMWFGTSNIAVRYLAPIVCTPQVIRKEICSNIFFVSVGFDEEELDESRISAYLSHMPSGTSVKNIAHYGQEVLSGRFAHFDHGSVKNNAKYGTSHSPDYLLSRIKSSSIALFVADNDWLASPKDVKRLMHDLRVSPFAVYNLTEDIAKFNHVDFVYAKHAGQVVNPRAYEVFEHFRRLDESAST